MQLSHRVHLPPALVYFLGCFGLWVIVDWGTAGGFRLSYFVQYGPTLLLFYLGYPLAFTWLIYRWQWNSRRLFLATLAAIFVVEVLFTRNPLVMNFPACLLGIPLAIAIYAPLTFFPLWGVRRELGRHRRLVVVLIMCELVVMFLTTCGRVAK